MLIAWRAMTFLHLLQAVLLLTHAKIALAARAHGWLMFSLLSTNTPRFFTAQLLLSNYHYEYLHFPEGQPFAPQFLNFQGSSMMRCWPAEFSWHSLSKINFKEYSCGFFSHCQGYSTKWGVKFKCFSTYK